MRRSLSDRPGRREAASQISAPASVRGAELAGLVERLRGGGLQVGGGQTLKSAPRGYPGGHPRIELLRCKGLICWRHWPVEPWLGTANAKERVVGFLRTAAPLHQWLDQHVGPDPG